MKAMLAWRKKPERSITRLQAIRISLSKMQVPFADEMGYNPRKYYRFEQSPDDVPVALLTRLHEKHKVNINWFLYGTGFPIDGDDQSDPNGHGNVILALMDYRPQ